MPIFTSLPLFLSFFLFLFPLSLSPLLPSISPCILITVDPSSPIVFGQNYHSLTSAVDYKFGFWSPCDTITISKGIYRENLIFGAIGNSTHPFTVTARSGDEGQVIVRGSDVFSGWDMVGNTSDTTYGCQQWQKTVTYSTSFSPFPIGFTNVNDVTQSSDMVFINGERLQQVGINDYLSYNMEMSSFYIPSDKNNVSDMAAPIPRVMTLCLNPNVNLTFPNDTNIVEISTRQSGIIIDSTSNNCAPSAPSSHILIHGVVIDHISSVYTGRWPYAIECAFFISGNHHVISNVTTTNNNWGGMCLYGDHITLTNVSSTNNGAYGCHGGPSYSIIQQSDFSSNGWRYPLTDSPAGIGGLLIDIGGNNTVGNQFVSNTIEDNLGIGFFLGYVGGGHIINGNLFKGNNPYGLTIQMISSSAPSLGVGNIVTNNIFADQMGPDGGPIGDLTWGGAGIELSNAPNTLFMWNTCHHNHYGCIVIQGGPYNDSLPSHETIINSVMKENNVDISDPPGTLSIQSATTSSDADRFSHYIDNNIYYTEDVEHYVWSSEYGPVDTNGRMTLADSKTKQNIPIGYMWNYDILSTQQDPLLNNITFTPLSSSPIHLIPSINPLVSSSLLCTQIIQTLQWFKEENLPVPWYIFSNDFYGNPRPNNFSLWSLGAVQIPVGNVNDFGGKAVCYACEELYMQFAVGGIISTNDDWCYPFHFPSYFLDDDDGQRHQFPIASVPPSIEDHMVWEMNYNQLATLIEQNGNKAKFIKE